MHYIVSIVNAQSGDALSLETDPLETHSFLLSSFIPLSYKIHAMSRSSRSQLFFKTGVLKILQY